MNSQSIIVPKISTLPYHETRARAILRWLVRKDIVQAELTTCGRLGNAMGYGISAGARQWVEHPERLPFDNPVNGLEIITKRCIYTAPEFREEAGCPNCRKEIGVPLFENLDEWTAKVSDNFTCPRCDYEDEINGFLFLQPCAFSNLGFAFNNWGAAVFKQKFLDEFAEWLDQPVTVVEVPAS